MPILVVRPQACLENVNSNSSNDFSGIKPGHDNRGGGKRNVLQFLCNFSSIDQKRARGGLRGELIDFRAAFLWDRGARLQAHEGPEKEQQEEKMVANGGSG